MPEPVVNGAVEASLLEAPGTRPAATRQDVRGAVGKLAALPDDCRANRLPSEVVDWLLRNREL